MMVTTDRLLSVSSSSSSSSFLIWTTFIATLLLVGFNLRGSLQVIPKTTAADYSSLVAVSSSSSSTNSLFFNSRLGYNSTTTVSSSKSTIPKTIYVPRPKLVIDNTTATANGGNKRKLYLVHVGKTGGETVRQTLEITCRMRANPINRNKCFDTFKNTTASLLSKYTIGTIHCGVALPQNVIKDATTFVWTLRNPISRVISWFTYTNPKNCIPKPPDSQEAPSVACNVNRSIVNGRNKWALKFFNCFDTVNEFAMALRTNNDCPKTSSSSVGNTNTTSKTTTAVNSNCTKIAWRTILGLAPTSNHMYYNHKYYWNQTIAIYPGKETFVIRTESLWDDVEQINNLLAASSATIITNYQNLSSSTSEEQLSQSKSKPAMVVWKNVTHGSETYKLQDTYLSKQSTRALCCALDKEFQIYTYLINNATNLTPKQKEATLSIVSKQCDININNTNQQPY